MSALFAGQRIKKVRGKYSIGATAVVIGHDDHPVAAGFSMRVRLTSAAIGSLCIDGETYPYPAGKEGYADPTHWEPILPEGMKPVEWSECLWQPEHLREAAHG